MNEWININDKRPDEIDSPILISYASDIDILFYTFKYSDTIKEWHSKTHRTTTNKPYPCGLQGVKWWMRVPEIFGY